MAVECEVKLMGCPWCKKPTTIGKGSSGGISWYYVLCLACGAQGPKRDTPEEAAHDWRTVVYEHSRLPTMLEMRQQTFHKLAKGDKVGQRGEAYEVVDRNTGDPACLRVKTVSGNVFIIREHEWIESPWSTQGPWTLVKRANKETAGG